MNDEIPEPEKIAAYDNGEIAFHCLERSVTSFKFLQTMRGQRQLGQNELLVHRAASFLNRHCVRSGFQAASHDNLEQRYKDDKNLLACDLKYFHRSLNAYQKMFSSIKNEGAEQILNLAPGFESSTILSSIKNPHIPHVEVDFSYIMEIKNTANISYKQQKEIKDSNIKFVGCDLNRSKLSDILAKAGFSDDKKTCVIMYGLISHLPEATTKNIFRSLSELPRGTEIIFNFHDEDSVQKLHDKKGVNAINQDILAEHLAKCGFALSFDKLQMGEDNDKSIYAKALKVGVEVTLQNGNGHRDSIKKSREQNAVPVLQKT